MSRDDRIELRELPAVPALSHWPERISMTLARWLDRCPRAAYLYVKTGGGAPTHQMDRGSLAHEAMAMMMVEWMRAGELGYAGRSDEEVSSMTATLVADVLSRHPEWEVSHEEKEIARLCVFHAALGLDVSPDDVVAVERKFVLELECGWTVSGKVDLASLPDQHTGQVDDYKTQLYVPALSEWDSFQTKMYAVFLVWGRPVERVECDGGVRIGREQHVSHEHCTVCGGRGYVEVLDDPIGGHLQQVRGRELYPRKDPRKRQDGKLWANERLDGGLPAPWTRMELLEFLADLNAIGERLSERLETWKFPARYGSWCGECPDEDACPIPRGYRRFAGHIKTLEQATEAWAWAQRMDEKVSDTKRDVRKFVAEQDVEIVAGDLTWRFQTSETQALRRRSGRADWDGLQEAINASDEPIDLRKSGWLQIGKKSEFKKIKRPADAVGEDPQPKEEGDGGREAGGAGAGGGGERPGDGAERAGDDRRGEGGRAKRRRGGGGSSDEELDARFGSDAPY